MNEQIVELSDMLEKRARVDANCFPVDRCFLEPYLDRILNVDRNDFLLNNLERASNTYTVQLLLCLPELWRNISVDDIVEIMKKFTNIFSYYSLIEFTHKYVEVNIIELILKLPFVPKGNKDNIVNYLVSSFYPNLIKTEGDYLFFREGIYGVRSDAFLYTKQLLLLDKRVVSAVTSLEEMKKYVESLV